jgi:hypothetical protein
MSAAKSKGTINRQFENVSACPASCRGILPSQQQITLTGFRDRIAFFATYTTPSPPQS